MKIRQEVNPRNILGMSNVPSNHKSTRKVLPKSQCRFSRDSKSMRKEE